MLDPLANKTFDICAEKVFDAVDALPKALARATVAALMLTSPVNAAGKCDHINAKDTLTLFGGYSAVSVEENFNTIAREACFQFKSLVPTMKIEPDSLCTPIDEDVRQSLWLKFPSGAALDISDAYSSEAVRYPFDHHYKVCHGLIGLGV